MTFFLAVLLLATFLCSLVAGLLFAFATVVMPGLRTLDDRSFIRAFQVIDGVIQNNQPLFLLVWGGSVVALIAAAVLGIQTLSGTDSVLLNGATLLYALGVQLPTIAINVPLNNRLQQINVDRVDEMQRQHARAAFEGRWNRWNVIRTMCASVTSLLLMRVLIAAG